MDEYTLAVELEPKAADIAVIDAGLVEYGQQQAGYGEARRLGIFLRDDAGVVVAGLRGHTYGGALSIDWVWVRGDPRGQGHGAQLMATAEQQARAWGLAQMHLDTFTFQAPGFYPKLGFQEFGRLAGFDGGHSRVYFRKRL